MTAGSVDWSEVTALRLVRRARPLLAFFPVCRTHPTIASLPEFCPDCRRWESARSVVADVDALLRGGSDA